MRQLIDKRLNGKNIGISPQAPGGGDSNRHVGDEMGQDLMTWEIIQSNGIAISRVIGWSAIDWQGQLKGLLQIASRQQVAGFSTWARAVGVGPTLWPPSQVPHRAPNPNNSRSSL